MDTSEGTQGTQGAHAEDVVGAADAPRAVDRRGRPDARDVAQLAEQSGFGAARGSHALGAGGVGCLSLGLAVALLPPGIGLVAGPYGPAVTGLGAALLAVAVALVPLALLYLQRHDDRIPRLYLFDGGIVLTRPPRMAACPWSDIRLVEYTQSVTVGQGGATTRVNRLRLDHIDGQTLCSIGAALPIDEIFRIAIAGGAQT